MTLRDIQDILQQAEDTGTVQWIYFEGGEPFLYYAILLKGVQEAASKGFQVGIVSNGYWATSEEDAIEWLRPFAGLVQDLSISSDLYHWNEKHSQQVRNANPQQRVWEFRSGSSALPNPRRSMRPQPSANCPTGESAVMYRGRAVEKLAAQKPTNGPGNNSASVPTKT